MVNWDDLVRDAGDAGKSFEPLPEGTYDFQVLEAEATTTKAGDKKMYKVKSKVMGGAHDGRFMWDNITLPPDGGPALGYFFRKMAGMGLTTDYFTSQKPSDERICGDLRGRSFRAVVNHRTYQGEKRHQIDKYLPQTQATPQAMTGGMQPPQASAPPAPAYAPPAPAPQAAPPPPAPAPAAAPPPPAPAPVPQAPPAQQDPWAQQPQAPQQGDPWQQPQAPAEQAPQQPPAPEQAPQEAYTPPVAPPPAAPF